MGNEQRFSGKVAHYDSARPAYADSLLNTLYSECGFSAQSVIADIGSGTGIFTHQLLQRGSTVYGVEPNADMRTAGEKRLKAYDKFTSIDGDAAHTNLPNLSVNIVTAAQALHWFPLEQFKDECKRILKPNGSVVIIYNQRRNDLINEEIDEVNAGYCDMRSASTGPAFTELRRQKINDLFDGKFVEIKKSNPLFMDSKKFIGYWLSRSYAPREGNSRYGDYVSDMSAIFNRYANDGIITIEQDSIAYIGC